MPGNSVAALLANAANLLANAGVDSPRLDARVLLANVLGKKSSEIAVDWEISEAQMVSFEKVLARRVAREPVAYITGTKEFFSLDFEVGPGVLIPRPESETLVEEAMRAFPDRTATLEVLDFGTGSACLIVAFLVRYAFARGEGVDASANALQWAQRNIARHGLGRRCSLRQGEWNANGMFDVVFANPPYLSETEYAHIAPEIGRYEPREALVADGDGMAAYSALAPQLMRALKAKGLAFVEIGKGRAAEAGRVLKENGLEVRAVVPDLGGIPRCLVAGLPADTGVQKTVGKERTTR